EAAARLRGAHISFDNASTALSETSDREATRILGAGIAFRQEIQNVAAAGERGAERLKAASADMADQGTDLRGESNRLAQQIAELSASLRQAVQELSSSAKGSENRLAGLGEQLARNASELEQLTERTGQAADKIGESYRSQAEELRQVSEKARADAANIEASSVLNRRKAFMRNMTFVTEQMNSLAVDLDRAIEKNVPEDAWERYLDGDRGIFARRIVRRRDSKSLDAIRANYEDDLAFREHVDRYLTQFQEALEQAEENDPEDILSAVLLSSDVGKLYMLMAKALGRLN
ncbi:MAG: hypothetical protein HN557_10915, partial [Rhodospirillaceae bacterium]|nr:hypothetical protein [Rhodospirillaceae bacterium]